MSLSTIIDTPSPVLDGVASVWSHRFPSADLVSAAVGQFTGSRIDDRHLGVTLVDGRDVTAASHALGVELGFIAPSTIVSKGGRGALAGRLPVGAVYSGRDHEVVEGPRWRILVSPGTVAVRYTDPVRADRTHERQERAARALADATALVLRRQGPTCEDRCWHESCVRSVAGPSSSRSVTAWSSKSRSRMVETLASLDWSPMFESTAEVPGMLTFTYPGDWLAVAPNAAACRRHLKTFVKRYERAWGRRLVGVWKREFQDRGAPHYHLLMTPPHGYRGGARFRDWAAHTWADIVESATCGQPDPVKVDGRIVCCERHRHIVAGVGLDFAKGVKCQDPRSIGVYFSKHGSFAAKDYQNDAPREWRVKPLGPICGPACAHASCNMLDSFDASVGRFWGRWGLDKAVAGVEVAPAEALAAVRTLRRLSRANSFETRVPVWRYRTVSRQDETGEHIVKWRRATKKARVYRVKGSAGYLVVKDGPSVAAALARHLDRLFRPEQVIGRSGAGPVGFLP